MGSCCSSNEEANYVDPLTNFPEVTSDVDAAVNLVFKSMATFSRLKIRLACKDLPDLDYFSKTDAFLILYEYINHRWVEQGRTEMIRDNLNPEFLTTIQVSYYFESNQKFKIAAFDADKFNTKDIDVAHSDYIGEAEFHIQNLVSSRQKELIVPFLLHDKSHKNRGSVIINYEEMLSASNQELELQIEQFGGDFVDGKGYFLLIQKTVIQGISKKWVPVMRTEKLTYNKTKVPWKKIKLPLSCLINAQTAKYNELETPIQINLRCINKFGGTDECGVKTTTIMKLIEGGSNIIMTSPTNETYKLRMAKCELKATPSFLDYIEAGCEMNLTIGVDFTGSNRDPRDYDSLHNKDFNKNQYLTAISAVGNIVLNFDTDQLIPFFGFGALINEHYYHDVSEYFAINSNIFRPEVAGLQGVVDSYKNVFTQIHFSGPTYFAPLLKFWNDMVSFEIK
jgi:hypothetical protein